MEKVRTIRSRKTKQKKIGRELILTVSMFLLNQEELRKQFWNVKTVNYDKVAQKVKIGINTTNGKLGTTLTKLRKTSKKLSEYLFDQGLTFRRAEIVFFVDKNDVELERIYSLLEQIDQSN
jgi:cell division protein FtsB